MGNAFTAVPCGNLQTPCTFFDDSFFFNEIFLWFAGDQRPSSQFSFFMLFFFLIFFGSFLYFDFQSLESWDFCCSCWIIIVERTFIYVCRMNGHLCGITSWKKSKNYGKWTDFDMTVLRFVVFFVRRYFCNVTFYPNENIHILMQTAIFTIQINMCHVVQFSFDTI